ncbi:small ribosomal subunit protein eS27-like [Syngnathoides biaculeatus]|uniref:small ribosomal subunit protein eS27-like n=1 Tax=Syngnathoides biaculeatus TaxID=300417 RepID=UPI002ADD5FBC|nr:small ribosomal subunit protein eS27-like [Syngnathoides biaculeatus]
MFPTFAEENARHKKKRLVQSPNSYFVDVKCMGCSKITSIFSHSQTVVPCAGCSVILCRPRRGKCKLNYRMCLQEEVLSGNVAAHILTGRITDQNVCHNG